VNVVRLNIALPPNTVVGVAKSVSAEIWDASVADAPAVLLTSALLHDVTLMPNGSLKTELKTAPADAQQTLIARVHISMDGNKQVKPGDLLTTSFIEIPPTLGKDRLTVPVNMVD